MTGRAVVPAGGRGSRLRPFTDIRPKSNAYMHGKRIMEYVVDPYVRAGFHNITFAVHFMADSIERYFGDGTRFIYDDTPLRIRYARADQGDNIVGDADAIRKTRPVVADALLVRDMENGVGEIEISPEEYFRSREKYELRNYVENFDHVVVSNCDILTNFDFSALIDFHKQRSAIATIALYEMEPERIVGNFGIAEIDENGVVKRVVEKPKSIKDVSSRYIITGIAVFAPEVYEYLTRNTHINHISRQLFPDFVEKYPGDVHGLVMKGYWNDIGTIDAYRDTQIQLIDGIDGIDTSSKKERTQKSSKVRGTSIHSVTYGCEVDRSSVIEDSILGDDVYIGPNVNLKRCIFLPGSRANGNVDGEGWIFDRGVEVQEGARVGKNVCIGSDTLVETGAYVKDDVKIGPGEIIKKGQIVENDILPEE